MAKPKLAHSRKTDKPKTLPSAEYLHQILIYDQQVEGLRWRVDRPSGVRAGERAGSMRKDGRRVIDIDRERYFEHRLVWKMLRFEEPPRVIDHISINDNADNRYGNLRAVTWSESSFHRSIFCNNTSGGVGVSWDRQRKKWVAMITARRPQICLGRFHGFEDAVIARRAAELKYFGNIAAEMAHREPSINAGSHKDYERRKRGLS
jgi:hypothetical protein